MSTKQRDWLKPQLIVIFVGFFWMSLLSGMAQLLHVSHSSYDLKEDELKSLKQKAEIGDAEAAWRIHLYYAIELHEGNSSNDWARRAAKLGHPQGQRIVADGIKRSRESYEGFGATAQDAVRNLLEKASRSSSQAGYELGSAYAEGYFGKPDPMQARYYFNQSAEMGDSMAWRKMAEYCHHGVGGPRDDSSAYYWISLDARCVHPGSIGGKEIWALRNEISTSLSLAQFEQQWKRIDAYIANVRSGKVKLPSPPFLKGLIKSKDSDEGEVLADKQEAEHREQMRKKLTPQ
ncbi:MAG: hypothetical protein B9S32_04635 [Verrucomicrobia bacterium Tous-C9LFEB]|nr:MAG: hypothetical protein B9S32_04635 [Verrucomicrobia bacterium Tous-C9LFEB]